MSPVIHLQLPRLICAPVPWRGFRGLGQSAGIQTLVNGIITQENAAPSLNNPGNLMYAGQPGATLGPNGLAQFDSYADGLQALFNQIGLYEDGTCAACGGQPQTIAGMTSIYAPASVPGNNPTIYANNLAAALGVPSDTLLSDVDAGAASTSTDLSSLFSNIFSDGTGSVDPTMLAVGAIAAGLVLFAIVRNAA